jgi:hypothetical protein
MLRNLPCQHPRSSNKSYSYMPLWMTGSLEQNHKDLGDLGDLGSPHLDQTQQHLFHRKFHQDTETHQEYHQGNCGLPECGITFCLDVPVR